MPSWLPPFLCKAQHWHSVQSRSVSGHCREHIKSDTMPLPQLPYKRPFFQITLAAHEIEVRLPAGQQCSFCFLLLMFLSPSAGCRRTWL